VPTHPRSVSCFLALLACGLLPVFVSGCARQGGWQSVSGKVLVNGQPAVRACVLLTPLNGSPDRPFGVVAEDGTFQMTGRDGARKGDYAVTVEWPVYEMNGGEEVTVGDRLGRRYADPKSPVMQVTIHDGLNPIPTIELRSP
jgi:hypothetical protein